MKRLATLLLLAAGLGGPAAHSETPTWDLSNMLTRSGDQTRYRAKPVDAQHMNPWPAELEEAFQLRAHDIITAQTRDIKAGVNTYFENEKRSYGYLMAQILGGLGAKPLQDLQAQDHQHDVWHRETEGIDYYACFTLKHQMRKYFYFGDLLEPGYRQRMFTGARKWTAQDPLNRPHHAFANQQGWGPDARNSWVDVRSTENLYLMRVTSVYLMAEETGNAETAQLYKKHLLDYTKTLYRIGIGEWDSENYLGHSIAPLLNLYDFARDPQVKAAAKACLDFNTAAGAVKYFRGGFNGPTKRDYNHAQPFGGSAANSLWVWFGGHPQGKKDHWESDEVHQITSAYRPPPAVVHLAQKNFPRPVEIFAAKPGYSATTTYRFDSRPEYLETQYIAETYLMGSLTGGTSVDGGDVNGFKILVWDDKDGAIALHAAPGSDPRYPGSPMYKQGVVPHANRVAQQQNLALWLADSGTAPWLWVIPDSVAVTRRDGITFLACDRTWVAVRPLGITPFEPDTDLTRKLHEDRNANFPGHQVLRSRGSATGYCGMAVAVGEEASHGSLERFMRDVIAAEVDLGKLEQGIVDYKAKDGRRLGLHWNENPLELGVWRNGQRRDLSEPALYASPVIAAKWGKGVLEIQAGGERFRCEVDEDGIARFSND